MNPGNSGGVLLDSQGQAIGVPSMIYSTTGASSGVGFALPMHSVNKFVTRILNGEKLIRRCVVGVGVMSTVVRTLSRWWIDQAMCAAIKAWP